MARNQVIADLPGTGSLFFHVTKFGHSLYSLVLATRELPCSSPAGVHVIVGQIKGSHLYLTIWFLRVGCCAHALGVLADGRVK